MGDDPPMARRARARKTRVICMPDKANVISRDRRGTSELQRVRSGRPAHARRSGGRALRLAGVWTRSSKKSREGRDGHGHRMCREQLTFRKGPVPDAPHPRGSAHRRSGPHCQGGGACPATVRSSGCMGACHIRSKARSPSPVTAQPDARVGSAPSGWLPGTGLMAEERKKTGHEEPVSGVGLHRGRGRVGEPTLRQSEICRAVCRRKPVCNGVAHEGRVGSREPLFVSRPVWGSSAHPGMGAGLSNTRLPKEKGPNGPFSSVFAPCRTGRLLARTLG